MVVWSFFLACFTAGVPSGQLSKIVTHMLFPDIVRIRQDPRRCLSVTSDKCHPSERGCIIFGQSGCFNSTYGYLGSQLDLPGIRGWQAICPMVFSHGFSTEDPRIFQDDLKSGASCAELGTEPAQPSTILGPGQWGSRCEESGKQSTGSISRPGWGGA